MISPAQSLSTQALPLMLPSSSAMPNARKPVNTRYFAPLAALVELITLGGSPAVAQVGRYSVQRTASSPTSGISTIRISNGSGRLTVTGRSGSSNVNATALVHGSSQDAANSVKLVVERHGDVLDVHAARPDGGWFDRADVSIDLTVEVPPSIALDVSDGSGGAHIDNVGAIRVRSGSGGVHVTNVGGDLIVDSKGSGSVRYSNVKGAVSVPGRRSRM